MKRLSLFLTVLMFGCSPYTESVQESEVTETIEAFFRALDVDNNEPLLYDQVVTDDFIIYEAGMKMNKQEFADFASGLVLLKSEWQLSDFRVSTDVNSAHANLLNNGTFEVEMDSLRLRINYVWLESAYLEKEEDVLKIKFYFSDRISMTTDTIR